MVTDTMKKEGEQFYLGIKINYDKEKKLDIFGEMKNMLKKLLQGPLHIALLIKELLISILHKDFITTQVIIGLGLALLFLVTQELAVASLLAAFLIVFLIQGAVYLIIMMRTYGLHLEVEVLVGAGLVFAVTVLALLTAVSLLVLSLSCMS